MEFHPLSELDARTKPEILARAREWAERESLKIRLREMREKRGVPEGKTALPRLERRKDIGVSALIDYVKSLGMGIEIAAVPKTAGGKREVLLRV